jgi:hypothetical protein
LSPIFSCLKMYMRGQSFWSDDCMAGCQKLVRFDENQVQMFKRTSRIIPNTEANKKRTGQRRNTDQKQENQEKAIMKSREGARASEEDKQTSADELEDNRGAEKLRQARPTAARSSAEDKPEFGSQPYSSADESEDDRGAEKLSEAKPPAPLPLLPAAAFYSEEDGGLAGLTYEGDQKAEENHQKERVKTRWY